MATDLQASDDAAPSQPTPPVRGSMPRLYGPAVPAGAELPLFRFRLRQLMIVVSLVSLLMAAMATSTGLTALVLLLAALVVTFHLFSTALGTQLRWHANRMQGRDLPQYATGRRRTRIVNELGLDTPHQRHRSPWHERNSTPLPWLTRLVVAAALCGGIFGAVLLSGTIGHRTSMAGIALGAFSLAVVAGWFAFVGYSFYRVVRHGIRDAMSDDRTDQSS
jgi:hypothetical protein